MKNKSMDAILWELGNGGYSSLEYAEDKVNPTKQMTQILEKVKAISKKCSRAGHEGSLEVEINKITEATIRTNTVVDGKLSELKDTTSKGQESRIVIYLTAN